MTYFKRNVLGWKVNSNFYNCTRSVSKRKVRFIMIHGHLIISLKTIILGKEAATR